MVLFLLGHSGTQGQVHCPSHSKNPLGRGTFPLSLFVPGMVMLFLVSKIVIDRFIKQLYSLNRNDYDLLRG